ncbi:MAG: hypothetical protein CBC35_01225 [Planctomycetes bacterium TMED75]|nr:hypothetical protein [Planctomycetaceae bacterium]OUU96425.1 MAG: hypothetical protein CBC35_01225 [Planctomycetes bacterium TMED75]
MSSGHTSDSKNKMLSGRQMTFQVIGFLIGIGLLYLCIQTAWSSSGDWSAITEAEPRLIVGLIGFGLVSTIIDGFVFWAVLRPYQKLKPMQVQCVNMTAAFLNYAPIRLGTIFRVTYHARVDHVKLIAIVGWFAAIIVTTLACVGSVVAATLLSSGSMLFLSLLTALFLLVSGIILWFAAQIGAVQRFCKGKEKMLGDSQALIAGLVGRLLVLASNTVRMGFAAEILDIDLGIRNVIILSVAALMLSFNPLGRVGWREWTLMMLTPYLAAGAFEGESVEAMAAQLALVESAGEFLAIIPFGILAAAWSLPRLIRGRREHKASAAIG